MIWHLLPFPRVQAEPVPLLQRYYEVLRRPAVLLAALRCLRLAIPSLAPVFVSPARPDAGLGPGAFGFGSPTPTGCRDGDDGASQVPGESCCTYALFFDPGRTERTRPLRCVGTAPAHSTTKAPTRGNFGAQSHGFGTRCPRFAVRLSPPHAGRASGCWPGSSGRDWLPAGFLRKVSEMQPTSLPPFPSFLGAGNGPLFPPASPCPRTLS
jgi:hypothetical protein